MPRFSQSAIQIIDFVDEKQKWKNGTSNTNLNCRVL